jgi:hypothetical protein
MRDNFNNLLQKPMDRKGFLKEVGMGLMMLTGASAVVTGLLQGSKNNQQHVQTGASTVSAAAYGASSYGAPKANSIQ